jgi:DNA replication and repair protein RecF
MPSIHKLQLTTFRNIAQEALELASGVNLIAGENGSGKSSLLEAIYFLGLGRSFRNTQQTPLIQHGMRSCSVFGELSGGITLGASRSLDDAPRIRVQGEKAQSSAELAKHLPLQLLNAEAFRLLEGGPKIRRQYIDWGVFHVKHQFHNHWREFQRSLQNRNILLKRRAPEAELAPWTQEFVRHAKEIDDSRSAYLSVFLPFLEQMLGRLIQVDELSLRYIRGWSEEEDISLVLERGLQRDLSFGHTVAGPQRADLKIKVGPENACDILSRGQQKLLVSAMKLAQGAFLAQESGQQCLYLIDDLPAELDKENRVKVCSLLRELGGQLFLTGTDQDELLEIITSSNYELQECKLFHVKHGRISTQDMPAGQRSENSKSAL